MYTLKLDWSRARIHAVHGALTGVVPRGVRRPRKQLGEWLHVDKAGATLKFDWTPSEIEAVQIALSARIAALARDMHRARDDQPGPSYQRLVAEQAALAAAAREIREYRAAAASG